MLATFYGYKAVSGMGPLNVLIYSERVAMTLKMIAAVGGRCVVSFVVGPSTSRIS
jgi:hypothetical protein